MSFHGQVTIQCNSKVLDIDVGTDALPIVIESGKEEERDLDSTSGYNHCFGLVIEFVRLPSSRF